MGDSPPPGGPASARNPTWSRDETVLLLDLYLRAPGAEERHPGVVELSELLNARALAAGSLPGPSFRNPTGIAMKLKNLAQQDPVFIASGRTGLPHGNALNAEVWSAYADEPDALAREVERIRGFAGHPATAIATPSRGPAPATGARFSMLRDGVSDLYVACLDGDARALLRTLTPADPRHLVKIGRTNDVERRCDELNSGFPPGSALSWRMLFEFALPDVDRAHRAEQALLRECARRGWSVGREFALVPLPALLPLARATAYEARAA